MAPATRSQWQIHFDEWLKPHWKTATPGLCFEAYVGGTRQVCYRGGEYYDFYDLASLTKVLFTVPAFMLAYHKGLWKLEDRVNQYLSWWPFSEIRIRDLLTHTSGLLWWKAFYLELQRDSTLAERWRHLQSLIAATPATPQGGSTKAIYSDVGFLSLAFVLEEIWQCPLVQVWELTLKQWASKSQLHWNTPGEPSFSKEQYAPTEWCPWRQRRLQAEVHDENAWVLGGLSSHAGLFGTTADVASLFLHLRSAYLDVGHELHSTVRLFVQRQIPSGVGDWAMGFVMPTPGQSTSGQYFSTTAIGHTGFTGTSVWWDIEKDWLIVILSNRLYYGREQRAFAKLRPLLHDEIVSKFSIFERE